MKITITNTTASALHTFPGVVPASGSLVLDNIDEAKYDRVMRELKTLVSAGTITVKTELDSKSSFLNEDLYVSVKAFGAIGNGIADDTAAIQAAIDHAMYVGKGKVYIPPGNYRITNTLHLGYGDTFRSVIVEGDMSKYRGGSTFCGACIVADFSDRQAINIQGARGTILRGISIEGKLRPWIEGQSLGNLNPTRADISPSDWDDPALSPLVDSRYRPYAAITLDAFAGPRPAVSYPDVTYPAYAESQTQYNKALSSDVMIEDVSISGFTVGYCNQPCDFDGNGDFTVLRRINMDCVKWGISVCNTQSRNVDIDNVKIGSAYCCLTNYTHGRQTGKLNGTISNLSVGACINIIKLASTAYAGPLTFLHLYGEACWRLGDIASVTANEQGIVFQSCHFDFGTQDPAVRGIPAYTLGGGQQAVDITFKNCGLHFPSVMPILQVGVTFDGCLVAPYQRQGGTIADEYVRLAHNALCGGVVLHNLSNGNQEHRLKFTCHDLNSTTLSHNAVTGRSWGFSDRNKCIPLWVRSVSARNASWTEEVPVPHYTLALDKDAALTGVSLVGRTLTFTYAGIPDGLFEARGPAPGDVLYDDLTGMVFFVSARTGTTVTAILQNNYKSDGAGGFVQVDGVFSTTAGNLYVGNSRLYTPNYPVMADLTSASTTLANCGRDDGYLAFIDGSLAVDDRVQINEHTDRWTNPDNKINSINGTTGAIVLNGPANKTASRKRLTFWIRKPPANV